VKAGETVTAVIDGEAVRFVVAEEVAFASSRWQHGKEQTRWQEREVIRTRKGSYVLRSSTISLWRGEPCTHSYAAFSSLEQLAGSLDATNPLDREVLKQIGALEQVSREI